MLGSTFVVVMATLIVVDQSLANPASHNTVHPMNEIPPQIVIRQTNACGQQDESRNCPYPFIRYGKDCFLLSTVKRTWDEARRYCQGLGGDLVNPNIDFLSYSLLEGKQVEEYGNGGRYNTNTRRYEDASGQELDPELWHPGLPQTRGPASACVYFSSTNQRPWANFPCSNGYKFICQY